MLRNDIKSYGKIVIEEGWMKRANRNFCAGDFGKIRLNIEGEGISGSIFSLLTIEILPQLLMSLLSHP